MNNIMKSKLVIFENYKIELKYENKSDRKASINVINSKTLKEYNIINTELTIEVSTLLRGLLKKDKNVDIEIEEDNKKLLILFVVNYSYMKDPIVNSIILH